MRDPADLARANAISFEVKKDGLTQRQSGDWQLRLTIAAIDMDQRITSAAMGTRFACVLVEVNDDESPRDHKAEERSKWRELGPAKQAGIRCKEPIFWAFLIEEYGWSAISDEESAARTVREICGVASRAELNHPGEYDARQKWNSLDNRYQAWLVNEHG
jgi:hypothetical protein